MLGDFFRSVVDVADEIVLGIDTRTIDSTWELAEAAGAWILPFDWCDDFAYARNLTIEGSRCDWILMLEADERLTPQGATVVREILEAAPKTPGPEAVTGITFVTAEYDLSDTLIKLLPTSIRLFRRRPEIRYVRRVHEEPVWLPDPSSTSCVFVDGAPVINHYGHCPEVWVARGKRERNARLLRMHLTEHADDAYAREKLEQTLAMPA